MTPLQITGLQDCVTRAAKMLQLKLALLTPKLFGYGASQIY